MSAFDGLPQTQRTLMDELLAGAHLVRVSGGYAGPRGIYPLRTVNTLERAQLLRKQGNTVVPTDAARAEASR